MKNFSPELKVGVFAIIVLLVLSFMTFKVGSLPFSWKKGYRLHASFNDIKGLDEKSRIKIAGVDTGVVEKIRLKDGIAELTLLMESDVKIYDDAGIALRMTGLLGDKYLSISPGSPGKPLLNDGDSITNVTPASDFDELAGELTNAASYIGDLAEILQDMFGESERKSIAETIENLRVATKGLEEIINEDREHLKNILVNLEKFSKVLSDKGPGFMDDLSRLSHALGDTAPSLVDNLSKAANELNNMIEENRAALKEGVENIKSASQSADNIVKKIDRGEGTIGKLLEDDKLYDSLSKIAEGAGKTLDAVNRLRTFMDFRSDYNSGENEWKGSFGLTLQPEKDKYYILGVVEDIKGSVEATTTSLNGVTTKEEKVESRLEFTAQFAKRFEDLVLRIGMIENTFGIGADYLFLDEKGTLSLNIWDFNSKEVDSTTAHAKIGVDYTFFKYLFISGGIDNFMNENRRGMYVGGGLKFEDKDFKYLFGSSPNLALP